MSKLGDWWKRIIREEYHLIITVPVEVITTDGMTTERFKEKQYAAKKIIKATPKHFIFKDLKLFHKDLPACQAIYRSGTSLIIVPLFFIK